MTMEENHDLYTSYSHCFINAMYQLTFMKWSNPTTDWMVSQVFSIYTNSQRFVSKLMLNDVQSLSSPHNIAQWRTDEEGDVDWMVASRIFAPAAVNYTS